MSVTYVAISNYGEILRLRTKYPRKELLGYYGVKHANRIYRDTEEGVKHVGWKIAGQWWSIYQPCYWEP